MAIAVKLNLLYANDPEIGFLTGQKALDGV
jgi:hypothetical protein